MWNSFQVNQDYFEERSESIGKIKRENMSFMRDYKQFLRDYPEYFEKVKSETFSRISWFTVKHKEILIIESFWEIIESW